MRPTQAECTIGNSKSGAAATLIPRGQAEPTKTSDLDKYNKNENENDIDNDNDDTNNTDDDVCGCEGLGD